MCICACQRNESYVYIGAGRTLHAAMGSKPHAHAPLSRDEIGRLTVDEIAFALARRRGWIGRSEPPLIWCGACSMTSQDAIDDVVHGHTLSIDGGAVRRFVAYKKTHERFRASCHAIGRRIVVTRMHLLVPRMPLCLAS